MLIAMLACVVLILGTILIKSRDPLGIEKYIYFSAVTYTPLGFGDLVPVGHCDSWRESRILMA